MVTVKIPCKLHIQKYLYSRYGRNHVMSKTSFLGILLFHVLDKNSPKTDINLDDYKYNFRISISERYLNSRGGDIGYKKRNYLAVCFEKIFWEDLMQFIEISKNQTNLKPIVAIRKFLQQHNISEIDVNFDSIYRKYQRENNKQKIKSVA